MQVNVFYRQLVNLELHSFSRLRREYWWGLRANIAFITWRVSHVHGHPELLQLTENVAETPLKQTVCEFHVFISPATVAGWCLLEPRYFRGVRIFFPINGSNNAVSPSHRSCNVTATRALYDLMWVAPFLIVYLSYWYITCIFLSTKRLTACRLQGYL